MPTGRRVPLLPWVAVVTLAALTLGKVWLSIRMEAIGVSVLALNALVVVPAVVCREYFFGRTTGRSVTASPPTAVPPWRS